MAYSDLFGVYSSAIADHTAAALAEDSALVGLEEYIENALGSLTGDIPTETTNMSFNQYSAVIYFGFFDPTLIDLEELKNELGCENVIVNKSDSSTDTTILTLTWSVPD